MRDGVLCHFVSMCPLKAMSQWKDKQQNSRVTALSIKRLFPLLARTRFHSGFAFLNVGMSKVGTQRTSAHPDLVRKAHAVPQNTNKIKNLQKQPVST